MNPIIPYTLKLAHGQTLELGKRSVLMGILNVTPDSFSDGGKFVDIDSALMQAKKMIDEGAQIIDIGGESTKPGAIAISESEEQARVLPTIEALKGQSDVLISIDTYRSGTASKAIAAGAHMINDVTGLTADASIADVAARTGASLCIMHTSRERELLPDVIEDQFHFLNTALKTAQDAGVSNDNIVIDPGFGFGKDFAHNLELMHRFDELSALGYPLLVGTSRKRFTGAMLEGAEDNNENRDWVTAATSVMTRSASAHMFRVHNVAINRRALDVADAVLNKAIAK